MCYVLCMCHVYNEVHLLENILTEETCGVENKNKFKKLKQISGLHKTAEFLEQLRKSRVFNTHLSERTCLNPSPVLLLRRINHAITKSVNYRKLRTYGDVYIDFNTLKRN